MENLKVNDMSLLRQHAKDRQGASSFAPKLTASEDTNLGFEALKLAQDRLGRGSKLHPDAGEKDKGRGVSHVDNPLSSVSTLDAEAFSGVAHEAKLNKLNSLVDNVSSYYKGNAEDSRREKEYLRSLDLDELESLAVAYEIANTHVLVMTSDLHAQNEAILSNRKIRKFYEEQKVCSTDDQIDMDRADRVAKNSVRVRKRR